MSDVASSATSAAPAATEPAALSADLLRIVKQYNLDGVLKDIAAENLDRLRRATVFAMPSRVTEGGDRDGIPNQYDRDRDGDGVRNRYDRRPDNPYRN